MKLFLILVVEMCSGCASIEFQTNGRGKFYIKSDILPVITNDRHFEEDLQKSTKILVQRNHIQYLFNYRF